MRDNAKTNDEKLRAAKAFEEAKATLKSVRLFVHIRKVLHASDTKVTFPE